MNIQRWKTPVGTTVAEDPKGEWVAHEDHIASHSFDEAAEIEQFAIAMVQSGRCAATKVVMDDLDDGKFDHFKASWDVWKACAMSRAKRFGV